MRTNRNSTDKSAFMIETGSG